MSRTQMNNDHASRIPSAGMVDMKLAVAVIPVSVVVGAKRFYGSLGKNSLPNKEASMTFEKLQYPPRSDVLVLAAESNDRISSFLIADSTRLSCRFGSRAFRQSICVRFS